MLLPWQAHDGVPTSPLRGFAAPRGSVLRRLAMSVLARSVAPSQVPPPGLVELLRCLRCGGQVRVGEISRTPGYPHLGSDGRVSCMRCDARYPLIAGTVRMLTGSGQTALWERYPRSGATLAWAGVAPPARSAAAPLDVGRRTAESFAYEWERFGGMREEWEKNFRDYMRPHPPDSFMGRLVLDVGTGSGRHAYHAARQGARVVAVDLGASIDVARRNLPPSVLTVQADAERLPLADGAFDFAMSIGVLHHLPDPAAGLRSIVRCAAPGGTVHVYLYWWPAALWQRVVLRGVGGVRAATVRLPHRLLHALCVPLAGLLALGCVWPYRGLRTIPRMRRIADGFPLKTYADYPFGVLVNDQFDRFSAPLERRFERGEVSAMLRDAGLDDVRVLVNHGWIGDGRRV
jgi:ubiquinone/menaquinone biosynthesis C-methylase UbiE